MSGHRIMAFACPEDTVLRLVIMFSVHAFIFARLEATP